jgi:hypothetical protein
MAEVLFTAIAIYKNGHYTFNDPNNQIAINSPQIDGFSPVNAWLLRYIIPGQNQVQYLLTFEPSSADLADPNTIQGVYVEQDGQGVLIDCISVAQFILVANGTGTIQRRYGAAPAFTGPTPVLYCVTRADDGSASAAGSFSTAYVGQYVGNIRLKSNVSGISVYEILSYTTPKAIGSDSVATC